MVMAGKRVVTAGVLAATLAVAAALWGAPTTAHGLAAHAVRQVKTTVAVDHRPGVVHATWRSATKSPAGVVPAVGVLIGLALVGTALAARRRPEPLVARPVRRGRAPPARTDRFDRY